MSKKLDVDAYVDVDGVLICRNGNLLELRNGAVSFLKFLLEHFENVYWLTSWHDGFNDVLLKLYAGHIARQMKTAPWRNGDKTTGVNFDRPFIWIEDGLCNNEMKVLEERGLVDQFIHTPFDGEMNLLYDLTEQLKQRFNITEEA